MNFSRALNILILAFLGLNLFLAYQIYSPGWRVISGTVAPVEKERLESYLQEFNYQLEAELPHQQIKSSFLTVQPGELSVGELKEKIFEGKTPEKQESDDREVEGTVYHHPEIGVLTVFQNGFYRFYRNPPESPLDIEGEHSREEAKELANHFLEERGLKPDGAIFDVVHEYRAGAYRIYYNQKVSHNALPVYAQLVVEVEEGKVTGVENYWLEDLDYQGEREMEIIPVSAALIRLLEELGRSSQSRTIKEVELGYYNPESLPDQEFSAEQWEIPPVWKVELEKGETYYLNALAGNLEEGL